ncbi:11423_t:CDS:2 [Paraglomus brasilianum]|uniref:11423_t:CDS:1 n=1 Tax=Paraglomus brasilianum TaxID=144538 RepID=A0A9N9ADG2_9GLOM|nr:11423_t:CDS:2 [Paraglomus brasilianum]
MLTITFARSSGPGGQNVNKLNTKVDMRFAVDQAYWIPEYAKSKLLVQQANHVNKKGEIVFTSDKTRSQQKNIEDCIDKLHTAIVNAAKVPKAPSEEQLQKIEDFKKAENRRRKEGKQKRSAAKAQRKWRDD